MAAATIAAVSVLRRRGPSHTRTAPARSASPHSASENPPSGPIRTIIGERRSSCSAPRTLENEDSGGAFSCARTFNRNAVDAQATASGTGSTILGILHRSDCFAALAAISRHRCVFACCRSVCAVIKGMIVLTPNSTAFSTTISNFAFCFNSETPSVTSRVGSFIPGIRCSIAHSTRSLDESRIRPR